MLLPIQRMMQVTMNLVRKGNTDGCALYWDRLVDVDDSLNNVVEGADDADCSSMESGDDTEKDDLDTGEDIGGWREGPYGSKNVNEPEDTETDIADIKFLLKRSVIREMNLTRWDDVEDPDTCNNMMKSYEPVDNTQSHPYLRQGYSGPTAEALRNPDYPFALIFSFMPVPLWQHIAVHSGQEMLPLRVEERCKVYS
ncbi:hypothetical protein F442_13332 [Phytophthora nicotianae P10297]|uniref:PiggyBac transposable element-derived protein domain-containing protein n=1 Tax=Phytophthora nicotianae P10297 TaxID=1317064 RepID=W2YW37_PHYNI|nr:hypothetical protein F442_13332 [Phytophthora nicotianae P10297]